MVWARIQRASTQVAAQPSSPGAVAVSPTQLSNSSSSVWAQIMAVRLPCSRVWASVCTLLALLVQCFAATSPARPELTGVAAMKELARHKLADCGQLWTCQLWK